MSTDTITSDITFDTRDRLIGRRIRAISGNSGVSNGSEYTVTGVYNFPESAHRNKIDRITVNVSEGGADHNCWVQQYELLPDEEVTFDTRERMIGKTIRVLYAGSYPELTGQTHVVTSTFGRREPGNSRDWTKVDDITVGITAGLLSGLWVQSYEVVDTEAPAEEPVGPKEWEVGDFVYTDRGSVHDIIAGVIVTVDDATVYLRSTPDFGFTVSKANLKECPVIGVGSKVIAHCVTPTQFREDRGVLVEITGMDYAGNFTGVLESNREVVTFSEWGPALDETGAPLDEDTAMFTDGDAVVVINRDDEWNGREGTYRGPESGGSTRHRIEFPGHGPAYFNLGEIARRTVEPVVEVAPEPVVDDSEVARLQRRLTAAEAEVASGKEAVSIIGGRLIEEANNRGWCSDYDRIIENVNSEVASGWELPVRNAQYEVTWTESYTVTVYRSATFTASDEDDAIEIAHNEETADRYALRDAIDNGNYTFDEADDYEASQE